MPWQKNIVDQSRIEVNNGNVHIGDQIILKDDQYFYHKLLEELSIFPYLINRNEQDFSIDSKIQVVREDSKAIVGVLHGKQDDFPDKYCHRLEYYLNDWIYEFQPSLIHPKFINIDWPVTYHNYHQVKKSVYKDLRLYKKASGDNPFEVLFEKYPEQHIVFFDIFSIIPNASSKSRFNKKEISFGNKDYIKLVKGFFEFWSNIPPRQGPFKLIALLIFKYPESRKRKWYQVKHPKHHLKHLLHFFDRCHIISNHAQTGVSTLLKELEITSKYSCECFVFPKMGMITLKHIDIWLKLETIDNLIGHLDLSQKFHKQFIDLKIESISLKQFKEYLVEFIKTA